MPFSFFNSFNRAGAATASSDPQLRGAPPRPPPTVEPTTDGPKWQSRKRQIELLKTAAAKGIAPWLKQDEGGNLTQAWLKGDGAIIPLLQTHALFQGCTWGLNYEPTYRKALALVIEHKPTPTSPVVTDPDLLELRQLAEGIAANQAKAVSIGTNHKQAAASKKEKKEESAAGAEMREQFTKARYSHSSLPSAAGFEQRRASLPSRRKYTLDEYAEHGDSFEEDFLTSGKVAPGWETTKPGDDGVIYFQYKTRKPEQRKGVLGGMREGLAELAKAKLAEASPEAVEARWRREAEERALVRKEEQEERDRVRREQRELEREEREREEHTRVLREEREKCERKEREASREADRAADRQAAQDQAVAMASAMATAMAQAMATAMAAPKPPGP